MKTSTDQTGRKVMLPEFPKRIISLVPSQTELLYYLGLENEVAGQTLFCVHPARFHKSKPRVGGTKKVDIAKIRSLNPDLVLANKEENNKDDIDLLATGFPVWVSDIRNIGDALNMIKAIGHITGKQYAADTLTQRIEQRLSQVKPIGATAVYLIWQKPFMAAGTDTFIHHMMAAAGITNAVTHTRYPELSPEAINQLRPELILLSSEPFPFAQKHIAHLQPLFPHSRLVLVDGEMFSWYGSRMLQAAEYFAGLRNSLVQV